MHVGLLRRASRWVEVDGRWPRSRNGHGTDVVFTFRKRLSFQGRRGTPTVIYANDPFTEILTSALQKGRT